MALESTDEEVEDWLVAGTVELGVVLNPAPGRAAAVLGRDAWVAVLSAHHPLGRRASESGVTLEELAAQLSSSPPADVLVTVRDWANACVLVREGMGVALVPESTLPEEQRGLRVMSLVPVIHREFGLVCSDTGQASRPAQALLDGLRKDGVVRTE
ncbi:TPA: LysR family transcriptional regulator substrate-binding protein [Pseudomonas aeruginosa]